MDRASSLIFPGSRTLVGWWRQLAPYQPSGMWIGYGFVHRIDAPVVVRSMRPLDPLNYLILQALALEESVNGTQAPGISAERLQTRLQLPGAMVRKVLADLKESEFLTSASGDSWRTTDAGVAARQLQQYPVEVRERRSFPFFERLDSAGQRMGPAQFVPIAECAHVPWPVGEGHRFDPSWLRVALEQSVDARAAIGLPDDVQSLVAETPGDEGGHVVLDRPERILLALILAGPDSGKELLGFAVKVDNWTLFERTPVLRRPASALGLFPEWFQEPTAPVWQEGWRGWCRQRQMPANEVEICSQTFRTPRLEVQAPARLVQRLQASKSDLFKNEAWILVGDGYVRTAALLSVRTTPALG